MPAIISEVELESIADELGFERGDLILSINNQKLRDLIDYKFAINSEYLEIELQRANGEIEEFEIEKEYDDDLGIIFESAVFDRIKPCTNHCIFCFVDQQPAGLRKSLYIKDDDYRLSYLQGTYITLTNMKESDWQRIEKLGLGPLYVSVHTTNPKLRTSMLNNPRAASILEDLNRLKKAHIPLHLQIVMCPGINDGDELVRTLNDLSLYKSVVKSIAVVPVGLTEFHKNKLRVLTKENAIKTINIIDEYNKSQRRNIAQASDEIFLRAQVPIPPRKYYGNFSQLEDGVGAIRLLIDDFNKHKKKLPSSVPNEKRFTFATSTAAALPVMQIVEELNKVKNLDCEFVELKNNYFGKNVTVAGLITGKDLISQLQDKKISNLIIPSIMLRRYVGDFLDGVTVLDVEKALRCKVFVIKDIYSCAEILEIILA